MKLGIILISLAFFACGENEEISSPDSTVEASENSGDSTQIPEDYVETVETLEENSQQDHTETNNKQNENEEVTEDNSQQQENKVPENEHTLSEITDVNGKTIMIKDLLKDSEFLILAINGTQCGFCRQEMRRIQQNAEMQKQLNSSKCSFAAVVIDYGGYQGDSPAHYWARSYPGFIGDSSYNSEENFAFTVNYFPTSYVVSKDGQVEEAYGVEGAVENYCQ